MNKWDGDQVKKCTDSLRLSLQCVCGKEKWQLRCTLQCASNSGASWGRDDRDFEGRKKGRYRYNIDIIIISVWIRYSSNGILVLGLRFALPCLPVFCRLSFVFILGGLVNSCSQQIFSRGKISEPSRCTPTPSQKGKKQKQTKTWQEQLCADGWVYARMPAGPEAPRLPTIGDEGTVSSRCDGLIFIIV